MVTYDETKRQTNLAKHGFDLTALSGFFGGTLLTRELGRVGTFFVPTRK